MGILTINRRSRIIFRNSEKKWTQINFNSGCMFRTNSWLKWTEYSILSSRDLKAHRNKPESLLTKHLEVPDVILHNHKRFEAIYQTMGCPSLTHQSDPQPWRSLSLTGRFTKTASIFSFSYVAAHYGEHQLFTSKNIIGWENDSNWRCNKDQQLDYSAITHSV